MAPQMSKAERERIISLRLSGFPVKDICKKTGITRKSVSFWLRRWEKTGTLESRRRSFYDRATSAEEDAAIVAAHSADPRLSTRVSSSTYNISMDTVRRRLREASKKGCSPPKNTELDDQRKEDRVINGGIIKREPEPEPAEDPDDLWENSGSEDIAPSTSEFNPLISPDDCSESGEVFEDNNKRAACPSKSNSPKRIKSEDILAESLKEVSTQLEVLRDDNLAGSKAQKPQNENDYHDNFGRYVASLLRLLPKRKSLSLQPKIVNMIVTEVLGEQDEDVE